jgi:hypothetical protein
MLIESKPGVKGLLVTGQRLWRRSVPNVDWRGFAGEMPRIAERYVGAWMSKSSRMSEIEEEEVHIQLSKILPRLPRTIETLPRM